MASAEYMRTYRETNRESTAENRRRYRARQRALAELARRYPSEYQRLLNAELRDGLHDVPLGDTG